MPQRRELEQRWKVSRRSCPAADMIPAIPELTVIFLFFSISRLSSLITVFPTIMVSISRLPIVKSQPWIYYYIAHESHYLCCLSFIPLCSWTKVHSYHYQCHYNTSWLDKWRSNGITFVTLPILYIYAHKIVSIHLRESLKPTHNTHNIIGKSLLSCVSGSW